MIDPRCSPTCVDSHILEYDKGRDAEVDRLVWLCETNQIRVLFPHTVRDELSNPGTPSAVRALANEYAFTIPVQLNNESIKFRDQLRHLLQGNSPNPEKHKMDADHLHLTSHYGGRYFLTYDDRMLDMATQIWSLALVRPIKLGPFLDIYDATST